MRTRKRRDALVLVYSQFKKIRAGQAAMRKETHFLKQLRRQRRDTKTWKEIMIEPKIVPLHDIQPNVREVRCVDTGSEAWQWMVRTFGEVVS